MAMAVCNSWNPLQSQKLLCFLFFFFFYAIICYYFLVVIPLHATALSFNLTNIGPQQNAEIEIDPRGDAYVSPQGIQLTANEISTAQNYSAGRATYKDPLFLWDNTSGKLTDFNTYFSFVIDSQRSNVFADGLTFFLVPNGSTPNITTGGAIGLPIGSSPTFSATTPFVAVEFDTFHNDWDPVNITPITHVGININSLNSSTYAIWNSDIIHGSENEAWISYNSSSQNLSVILRPGSVNNSNSAESSISFVVDLKTMLPEWVTIGFSAATGTFFEKNNIKSWAFNSTLHPSPSPSPNGVTPSPGKKMGENKKKALVVGFTVGSTVLVGGLALFGFVLWKKGTRAKQEDEFAIELSMYNDFEAELADLGNVETLGLSSNLISGIQGCETLSRLKKLGTLSLSDNYFNKSIILCLSSLISLKNLFLELTVLENLEMPELARCGLSSLTMQGLASFYHLEILDLQQNGFYGSVPPFIGASSLKALYLNSNKFNVSLPIQGLCELKKLVELDLSYNHIEGILPPCLSNLTSLGLFDVSGTNSQKPFIISLGNLNS
ncbi:hypothetical protein LOK49_LG12G00410 [Camellia lanceoleosa]|uniref:Uncharacterized protein n=1 Tax=Camellia lanceoleosa TaxID=1840588 RepID=A0ACC0FQN7_9ERIC|nr:hypothetical protein LOK49_LG12G00410 [Camellia lanceoleosa]